MDEDRIVDITILVGIVAVIVLKITGVITIPWLWLLSPLWIPFCIGIVFALGFVLIGIIEFYIEDKKEKENERC